MPDTILNQLSEKKQGHFVCKCGKRFECEVKPTVTCPTCGTENDPVEASETARADIW